MPEEKPAKKRVNLSLDIPEDVAAIIEHHAIVQAREPTDILQEIVQKIFDDHGKEISGVLGKK